PTEKRIEARPGAGDSAGHCRRTNWVGRVFRAYRLAEKSPFQCEHHRLADVRRNDPAALRNRAARLLFPCATRVARRSHARSTTRISETKHLAEVPSVVILLQMQLTERGSGSRGFSAIALPRRSFDGGRTHRAAARAQRACRRQAPARVTSQEPEHRL